MNLNIFIILLIVIIFIYLIILLKKYNNKKSYIILFLLFFIIFIVIYYYIYLQKNEKFNNKFTNDKCCNEDEIKKCEKYGKIAICNYNENNNTCICQNIE
jgi:Na+/melibiose symporter-like transporter